MRFRRPHLLALLLFVLLAAPTRFARAEDDPLPPGMSEDEVRVLRTKLRRRAAEWWRYRKTLAMRCPQCKGAGKVRWRQGRRRVIVDCPKCDGHKMFVDKDEYRRCFYDMRSPAFRMQEGIQNRVTKEFVAAKEGRPFPQILDRYKLEKIEIVDASHGLVWVEKNKESVARPQEWVWSEEVGKSTTWFLYDAQADGPWPSAEACEPAPPPAAEPERPAPTPAPPPEAPTSPEPAPTPPPRPDTHEREVLPASVKLIKRWGEERGDLHARVVRIELGLEGVEGHEKKVGDARKFLSEIEAWLAEAEPFYEQAREEVEVQGLGVRMDHRIKVNTLHFRAFRRLELTEKMLIAVIPDPDD
jgi:hypothetical protein